VTEVLAPCAGRVLAMSEAPDPVFAGEMVGPGVVIDPDPGEATVVSPIAGKVIALFPHAFVVMAPEGVGVLVHLGINTVKLEGKGFELLVEKGAAVEVGTPMVRWDPSTISGEGISAVVPIVAMERPKGSVQGPPSGTHAAIGDLLFTIDT
jgi:sugar PTS system EIIA component